MTLGSLLGAARQARGVTLEQAAAATRVRVRHLAALEDDRLAELPAPVYVRGYLRTYAGYLETDADPLLGAYEATRETGSRSLAIRPMSSFTESPNIVLTAPLAGGLGLVLLMLAFSAYVYRELESIRTPAPQPHVAATALASPSASPPAAVSLLPAATPAPALATLVVSATDTVWIDVQVDGKPQFADAGRIIAAGTNLTFRGARVKVSSGKGIATLVNLNGRDLGPMGGGVVTHEYTSP